MSKHPKLLLLLCLVSVCTTAMGQYAIRLKSRTWVPEEPVNAASWQRFTSREAGLQQVFCLLQFNAPVTAAQQQLLAKNGVMLHQYVPDNTYTASINKSVSASFLAQHAIALAELLPSDKRSSQLSAHRIPHWAVKSPNTIDLIIHFNQGIAAAEAVEYLRFNGGDIIDANWLHFGFVTIRVAQDKLDAIAAISFVEYIEPIAPDPQPLIQRTKVATRANLLQAPIAVGGYGLSGKGVTIGIGDNADPSAHVDLADRVINRAAGPRLTHGTHVAGIAAGGGILDPLQTGIAPEATILSQLFDGILLNAAAYVSDYRMVITNNSWGNITGECDLSGVYDSYSRLMDELSIRFPYLLHIFAAGNDGSFTCRGFPQQFHTTISGHQSAKNVLSVGWAENQDIISPGSSVGPLADGRMKPEIISIGSAVRSTAPTHQYIQDWGSSMAAPGVAGGAALLIERYRQLHNDADPKSGLIKALLMNGARDVHNPAPDHRSGFGFLHLGRSIEMLQQGRYLSTSITNGNTNNHTITIPANTAQLKVMIYWHDPAAAVFAQPTLVNDLDIEVISPSNAVVLPWVLATDSSTALQNAARGIDSVNNAEQITIQNPVPGNYTIRVKGAGVRSGGAQEYFIVYDLMPNTVQLTHPAMGEPMVPGEEMFISWDAWGDNTNTFNLEFSVDNGATWTNLANNIAANTRQFNWQVPGVITDKARIRIQRNNSTQWSVGQPFAIIGQPQLSLDAVQCEGYIHLNWTAVSGATHYEVMMKQGSRMMTVASTQQTNWIFSGLHPDTTYWVSVRAMIQQVAGRRAIAISRQPESGSCAGSISDFDLKLDSVIAPTSGRKFTSTEITTNELQIRIRNLDDAPLVGFNIQYSINNGPFVSFSPGNVIAPLSDAVLTMSGLDFSAPGDYLLTAVVTHPNDINRKNDTFRTVIRQLANAPVSLPYTENFDTQSAFEIIRDSTGITQSGRWDFFSTTGLGRLRSFVNTGIARSGNRAFTMDVYRFTPAPNTNYLTATFNLGNYSNSSAAALGLTLQFSYQHHGRFNHPDNRVWARRNDQEPWVEVFNFDTLELRAGEWKTISVHLSAHPQLFPLSSSFQLRFGQFGFLPMGDRVSNNGISIDDVALLSAPNDVALIALTAPVAVACQANTSPVIIRLKSYGNSNQCIPVKYQLNDGAIITECAPATAALFAFNTPVHLPPGTHQLKVWTDHPADNYRINDTITQMIVSKHQVRSMPYLEDFERGPGGWHTAGYLSSWEWGTPASLKINRAASGRHAWKTSLRGQYNEYEESYLYSPCFDISGLSAPFLSFQLALDIEQCGAFICDELWIEYSTDGQQWQKLGRFGDGINWYNNATRHTWDTANRTTWHTAGIALPLNLQNIQFRFVLRSDAGVTREGVAIDDIRIYDRNNTGSSQEWRIYPNPVNNWMQLISIHPEQAVVNMWITDITGRKMHQQQFRGTGGWQLNRANISGLAAGMYLLHVDDGSRKQTLKLIKH